eukprot:gnl/TRDRNA2_/TRDRNA2_56800_c0_seq1.p1 gnl/TRDRNA2_/TRDRNA2_56800_c0~~gnl/TRDRNA2_/TRDRNA2_56800_c0_seq1.p1  ORF type:complete len:170 (+),score=25.16 gnl/TRDRNA2_/TRDRNA2_56800_c0_seq1:76-585(+)
MGCSESVHNDTNQPVQVRFQLFGGACPIEGCHQEILQPHESMKERLTLSLPHQVCITYGDFAGEPLDRYGTKVCRDEMSRARVGPVLNFTVSEILGNRTQLQFSSYDVEPIPTGAGKELSVIAGLYALKPQGCSIECVIPGLLLLALMGLRSACNFKMSVRASKPLLAF